MATVPCLWKDSLGVSRLLTLTDLAVVNEGMLAVGVGVSTVAHVR